MPNEPIEFILVRPKGGGGEAKFIPRTKYEAQRDLWAQVAGGKTVDALQAPAYEPTPSASATTGGTKSSGQSAEPKKES
jgi:hypothetical protein